MWWAKGVEMVDKLGKYSATCLKGPYHRFDG